LKYPRKPATTAIQPSAEKTKQTSVKFHYINVQVPVGLAVTGQSSTLQHFGTLFKP